MRPVVIAATVVSTMLVVAVLALHLSKDGSRSNSASTSGSSNLAPPGSFHSLDDAERASGYHIPRLNDQSWQLFLIDVGGPNYGVCPTPGQTACAPGNRRTTYVTYVQDGANISDNGRNLQLEIVPSDTPIKALEGLGTAKDTKVNGVAAIQQERALASVLLETVQWEQDRYLITARATLGRLESPNDNGTLNPDRFLALLARVK